MLHDVTYPKCRTENFEDVGMYVLQLLRLEMESCAEYASAF